MANLADDASRDDLKRPNLPCAKKPRNLIDPEGAAVAGIDACYGKPMEFELSPTITCQRSTL